MHMMTDYFGPDMRVCVWMKYVSRYVKIILMYETVSMRLCYSSHILIHSYLKNSSTCPVCMG